VAVAVAAGIVAVSVCAGLIDVVEVDGGSVVLVGSESSDPTLHPLSRPMASASNPTQISRYLADVLTLPPQQSVESTDRFIAS
jgi:hypothetical protein